MSEPPRRVHGCATVAVVRARGAAGAAHRISPGLLVEVLHSGGGRTVGVASSVGARAVAVAGAVDVETEEEHVLGELLGNGAA